MKLLKSATTGKIAGGRVSRWLLVLLVLGGLLLQSTVVRAQSDELDPIAPAPAEAWDPGIAEDAQLAVGAPALANGADLLAAGDPQTAAPAEVLAVTDWARVRVWGDGVDMGRRPSIGIHPNNSRPFISFYGGADGRFMLAWRTGNVADLCGDLRGWRCAKPHDSVSAGDNSALAFLQNGSGQVGVVHSIPAIKTLMRSRYDAEGNLLGADGTQQMSMNPSTSYINVGDLVYQGGAAIWSSEIFDAGAATKRLFVLDERYNGGYALVEQSDTATSNKLGRYASLDLGAGYNGVDGMTTRAAYSGVSGVLRYAEWRHDGNGSGCQGQIDKWLCRTVDHDALVYSTSLYAPKCAGCNSDRTRIAYFDAATGKLKLATHVGGSEFCNTGSAPGWRCQTIDAIAVNKTADGVRVSMVVQNGQIKIAYIDKDSQANSILKLATYTGVAADVCIAGGAPGWKCEVVDNGDNQDNTGIEPSLAWVGNQLYIAYHNLTKGRLMVAHPKANLAGQVSFNLNMPATPVVVGGEFIFSYLINNQAATTLTGLAFDDYVALRYELLAVQQTTCPATVELDPGNLGSTVRMRNGALASGATCQITIKAKVRTGTPPSVYTEALDQPLTSHEAYPVAGNTTSLTVKAQQVITFAPLPDHTYGDAPFAMNATASSGLPVSFSSNTPAICTVAGNTVTLVGAGSMCQITAQQAGDAQYMPAAATKQFFVAKRSQTITFAALADKVLGAAPFAVSAASSAGLPVSFASTTPAVCTMAGATVTLVSAGTCAIVASQAGNANTLAAASVTRQFAVTNPAKQNQTISFAALGDKALGAAPFAVSATASSGLPVSFASNTPGVCTTAGNTVTLVAAGTCTIAATQGGNNVYNPAPPMARSFVVQNASGPVLAQKIFLPVVTR